MEDISIEGRKKKKARKLKRRKGRKMKTKLRQLCSFPIPLSVSLPKG